MTSLALLLLLGLSYEVNATGKLKSEKKAPPTKYVTQLVEHIPIEHEVTVPLHTVGEAPHKKKCLDGYDLVGDSCERTITVLPIYGCEPGFERDKHENCVKFAPKRVKCPAPYHRENGECVHLIESSSVAVCPDGYGLTPDRSACFTSIKQPPKYHCPDHSFRRGNVCISIEYVPPIIKCLHPYVLVDGHCKEEEEYDCTPEHGSHGHQSHSYHSHPVKSPRYLKSDKGAPARLLHEVKDAEHHAKAVHVPHERHYKEHKVYVPVVQEVVPTTVKEYVVGKTCKRIRTTPPIKECPHGSILVGDRCELECETPLIEGETTFKEEFTSVIEECPPGFTPGHRFFHGHHGRQALKCWKKEAVEAREYCPPGFDEETDRCVLCKHPTPECPKDFQLLDDICIKRIRTPPTIEWAVFLQCTGKDCDHKHRNEQQHHVHHGHHGHYGYYGHHGK